MLYTVSSPESKSTMHKKYRKMCPMARVKVFKSVQPQDN